LTDIGPGELDQALVEFVHSREEFDRDSASMDPETRINASLGLAFKTAVVLALRNGAALPQKRAMDASTAEAMSAACRERLSGRNEYDELEIARDTFGALAALWWGIERQLEGERPRTIIIGAAYFDLGIKFAQMGYFIDGVWRDYLKAAQARERLSVGGRSRHTPWRAEFEPILRDFCVGRTKVTRGQIIRLARRWCESREREGCPIELPKDQAIWKGILKLEAAGLVIPGRKKGSTEGFS
jgi:hypothetical protein